MTDTNEDYVVDTRRMVKDISGNRRTVKSIDISTGSTLLSDESIQLRTNTVLIGDGTDVLFNKSDVKTTYKARQVLADLLTGNSTEQISNAKIGSSQNSDRRDTTTLNNTIKSADSITVTVNSDEIVVETQFNNVTDPIKEFGILSDNNNMLQYHKID